MMSGSSSSPSPSPFSLLPSEILLPPNWTRRESASGEVVYVNEISGEQSAEHPYRLFLQRFAAPAPAAAAAAAAEDSDHAMPMASGQASKEASKECKEVCEYHCQWTERDVHGDVSMYGLTIRMHSDGRALVRFDGIDAAWSFASLEGLYGPLGPHDLFVGAKVSVFGRHFTISAVNAHAARFIAREKRRLEAQQEQFRRRIESVGATPCVKRRGREGVQDISRGGRLDEQTNLRALLKENARFGEQLAQLGLAYKL